MREIRFRAWDKANKIMYDSVLSIHWLYGEDLHEIQIDTESGPLVKRAVSFEIMQYTGIKDKNGVDIYEGDIVRSLAKGYWQDITSVVAWIEGDTGWNLFSHKYEVIGNIYQNPELLTP